VRHLRARKHRTLPAVTFNVAAESYDRFMGRYSKRLAAQMADLAGIEAGQRVLDVGAGTGMLTAELVDRVGADRVAAVDPSEPFVTALGERFPGVEVQHGAAEQLPFEDGVFDAALAQLVVHFMSDPVRGLSEMARVTRDGGVVAACVWDHAGKRTPIAPFWEAVTDVDPEIKDEEKLAGGREGHLVELLEQAGVQDVQDIAMLVLGEHETFDDWWEPFTLGVGPSGATYQKLPLNKQQAIEARARELLPAPITLETYAWAARGVARHPQP
jgi:ubiquinone/menaquinone biosynthesis C-methylase UbiE